MPEQDQPTVVSRRRILQAGAALGGAAWMVPVVESFTPAAAASSPGPQGCVVVNSRTRLVSTSLADAVANASAGDGLVLNGTCAGGVTISVDLAVSGHGSNPTVLGDGSTPVMTIGSANVTLTALTLSGGGAGNGGGIDNGSGGTLSLTNCTVTGNSAGADGGGIYNGPGGTVTLSNCTLRNNAAAFGGGIYNSSGGTLNVTNTIITANTAGQPDHGGGIYNLGTLSLSVSSSVTGNTPNDIAP
jgi:hypothetical protein